MFHVKRCSVRSKTQFFMLIYVSRETSGWRLPKSKFWRTAMFHVKHIFDKRRTHRGMNMPRIVDGTGIYARRFGTLIMISVVSALTVRVDFASTPAFLMRSIAWSMLL